MSYLDQKYINLISPSLRNFKRKGGNLFNFSCPMCGDSQKKKSKARGYAYEREGKMWFTCHNCGITTSAKNLIKHVSPALHMEYVKEMMMDKYTTPKNLLEDYTKQLAKSNQAAISITDLQPVNKLSKNHICRKYVEQRMIPATWWSQLYYAPHFMEWTNTLIPKKFSEEALEYDEERLVIPLVSQQNKLFGFQGRQIKQLDNSSQKYYTIILDNSQIKAFGLDKVDLDRTFYVVEGPLDSMFIPNSIAAAGSTLAQIVNLLDVNVSLNAVLCFDNEPRAKITCKKMDAAISLGHKVVFWPSSISYKDVNEMILGGLDSAYIQRMIDDNTKQGLEAKLEMSIWKRC